MGFLSKIGKIASWAAPIAATAFTGGAAAPSLWSKIASVGIPMAGKAIGAATDAAAKNRGTNVSIELEQEKA